MSPVESPFQQVGHEPPRLPWSQRLGSLGLAALATTLLVALVFVLWWLWLTWMPVPDPKDGPIPVLLDREAQRGAVPATQRDRENPRCPLFAGEGCPPPHR